jgi:hypothetical protein
MLLAYTSVLDSPESANQLHECRRNPRPVPARTLPHVTTPDIPPVTRLTFVRLATFTRWSTGQISDKGSVMTSRNPVVPKLLALGVSLSALLPASGVHSEVSSLLGVAPTQCCERWRDNALLGARQQLRGASREIQYVNVATLVEMIEHGIDRTKLFVMAGEYTPAERQFLEGSILAGYDRMAAFRSAHPDQRPNYKTWQGELYEQCLASSEQQSQATQGNGLTPALKE